MHGAIKLVASLAWTALQFALSPIGASAATDPLYEDWTDTSRQRVIPLRFYLPPSDGKPHPVVIFSHGLGGSRDGSTYLGDYWSEHGYVCIFVQHPGSDNSVWKPVAAGGQSAVMAKLKPAANVQQWSARVKDIKFVLDQLPSANKTDRYLKGQMDLSKIAMTGHSFGAGTTLAIAGQGIGRFNVADSRIKAAIPFSPPVNVRGRNPGTIFGGIKIPTLVMTGTEDSSPIGGTKKEDRRLAFDGMPSGDKYLIVFEGGDHMIFNGRWRGPAKPNDKAITDAIEKLSTAFLDAYLKGDANARTWLQSDARGYLGKTAASWEIK